MEDPEWSEGELFWTICQDLAAISRKNEKNQFFEADSSNNSVFCGKLQLFEERANFESEVKYNQVPEWNRVSFRLYLIKYQNIKSQIFL